MILFNTKVFDFFIALPLAADFDGHTFMKTSPSNFAANQIGRGYNDRTPQNLLIKEYKPQDMNLNTNMSGKGGRNK